MTYIPTKRTIDPGNRAGYVYVIQDEQQRIKLGFADNVEERLAQLQTGNADVLMIVYRLRVNNMRKAETALHSLFAAYRLRKENEWFRPFNEKDTILLAKIFGAECITAQEQYLLESLGLR